MAAPGMTRRSRKYFKKIQRAKTHYDLQSIASTIQTELDRRNLSYDEALNLGNFIQNRADQLPGNSIVYALYPTGTLTDEPSNCTSAMRF